MVPTREQKSRFVDLECDLSPENLSRDGQASEAEVERRRQNVLKTWKKLEDECRMKVTHEMAGDWMLEGIGV